MATIALCLNLPELAEGGYRDMATCRKYPGAGWVAYLTLYLEAAGHTVMSGRKALAWSDYIPIDQMWVIQEEDNEDGRKLLERGAKGKVLFCLESPIFANRFYDALPKLIDRFESQFLFSGGTHKIRFPSFDFEDLGYVPPFEGRELLCMVSANKHYAMLGPVKSESYRMAMATQLHDERFRAIDYFRVIPGFKLYGKGWPEWLGKPCDNKLDVISKYKFSLSFENGAYPGYVTEKVIDCLVAGVVPVYMGAPNIYDYVPDSAIIRIQPGHSFENLCMFLMGMKEAEWERMIEAGQTWIKSVEGMRHSYGAFAKEMTEAIGA